MIKDLFNIEDLEIEDEELKFLSEVEEPSQEQIKNNIPTYNSKKLCQIIVCHRYLNNNKDLAIYAMEELSKRRESGDTFDFEQYITASLAELPVLNFKNFNIMDIIHAAVGKNK